MSKLKTLQYLWNNNRRGIYVAIFDNLVHTGIFNPLPDKTFVSMMYRVHTGKHINLDNPKGFNEKLQWLKLYDHNPDYIDIVDKHRVKEIVGEKIGQEYIIPTLGVWDSFDDIDFSKLPDQFVLKCTHDSGSVCICKDKNLFNYDAAKKILSRALKKNLYYWGREWPYKAVKPRIIAEKYLIDSKKKDLIDYKLMCFKGVVECSFTVTNRFSQNNMHVTFYDTDWNKLPFTRHYRADSKPIEKPESYDLMVKFSELLSKDIPFARIDWYEIEGKPYFGEITLYPGNGIEEFEPEEWDYKLGEWIELPNTGVLSK